MLFDSLKSNLDYGYVFKLKERTIPNKFFEILLTFIMWIFMCAFTATSVTHFNLLNDKIKFAMKKFMRRMVFWNLFYLVCELTYTNWYVNFQSELSHSFFLFEGLWIDLKRNQLDGRCEKRCKQKFSPKLYCLHFTVLNALRYLNFLIFLLRCYSAQRVTYLRPCLCPVIYYFYLIMVSLNWNQYDGQDGSKTVNR